MRIVAVGQAFPQHYYDQETLVAAFEREWGDKLFNPERLSQLHRNVLVGGRYLTLPMERYAELDSFTAANAAFVEHAPELGSAAILDGLSRSGLEPSDLDHLFFVTVTGVATPSIDALIVNRLNLSPTIKRTPIFGLGCVAGVAGVARAADYLLAFPEEVAVLLSVELCSLTLQRSDVSIPNLIASGLFGDGAAAVVLVGAEHPAAASQSGPRVVATRAVFYPDTEDVMGWKIGRDGFQIVLSADVPIVVETRIAADVDGFLAENGLVRDDISSWVAHPGGPRVLEALQRALGLPREALRHTWSSLAEVGNLSSASVLMVLRDTMADSRPREGSWGLMLAMGPGFCSEFVLLRW